MADQYPNDILPALTTAKPPYESPSPRFGYVDVPGEIALSPSGYAVRADGECLSPLGYHYGDYIFCDPAVHPSVGDVAIIWFNDPDTRPMVKVVRSSFEGCGEHKPNEALVVEQLNPAHRFTILWSEIRAVHKVVGHVAAM